MSQFLHDSNSQSVSQCDSQSVGQSVNQCDSHLVSQSISVSQSVSQSVNQCDSQSVSQSASVAVSRPDLQKNSQTFVKGISFKGNCGAASEGGY